MLSVKRCTSSELFMVAQINSQGQHRTNSTLNSAVRKQKPPLPCPLQVLSRRSGGAEGRGPTRPKRHTHNASYRSVDSIPERALFSVSLFLSCLLLLDAPRAPQSYWLLSSRFTWTPVLPACVLARFCGCYCCCVCRAGKLSSACCSITGSDHEGCFPL